MIIIKGLRILFELSSIYLICVSLYTAITGKMGLALFTMFIARLMLRSTILTIACVVAVLFVFSIPIINMEEKEKENNTFTEMVHYEEIYSFDETNVISGTRREMSDTKYYEYTKKNEDNTYSQETKPKVHLKSYLQKKDKLLI